MQDYYNDQGKISVLRINTTGKGQKKNNAQIFNCINHREKNNRQKNYSLNSDLTSQGLAPISYRISANYGKVELAISLNSHNVDLFGPPVNICSKINRFASSNQMIIHQDLLQVIKDTPLFNEYIFNCVSSPPVAKNIRWPISNSLTQRISVPCVGGLIDK